MDVVQEHIPALKPCAGREIDAAGHVLEAAAQHVPAHVARVSAAERNPCFPESGDNKAAAIVVRPPAACLVVAVAVVRRYLQRAGHGIVNDSHGALLMSLS